MSDMQDNNVNANAGGEEENPGDQGQERKYTDADVDKIVARKIAVERDKATKKHDTELEQRERDVLSRELTMEARDKLTEANLPRDLSDLMDYSSKEAFEASYDKVVGVFRKTAKPKLYGRVPRNPDGMSLTGDPIKEAFAPQTR